jgi:glycosyltransferase involved in cell wall biosynthesis
VRIFGWAVNHSGCGQYRIGIPMWGLGQAGHDALAFSVLNTDLPTDLDVLVGQLVCTPEQSALWQEIAAMPGRRPALVFELDDDIWNLHSTNYGAAGLKADDVRTAIERNLALADAVTVTTNHLAEVVSRFNANVHVLPNCVDAALLQHQRPRNDRVTIGWAGGSSHSNDFAFVRNELRSFLRRNADVDVHMIGTDYRHELGRPDARHSGWSENLVDYLSKIDFDIGIAPLAYHAFNKSKSDLKVLEYAALGIPVVATDFGPYSDSVQHGVTGFLVKRPHEWARYLRDLVNDEAMRTELGANARRWAATRTIQANVWRWETAYRSAIDAIGTRSAAEPEAGQLVARAGELSA